ncbi:hypothetical protein CG017_01743 [Burkholderia glumae]|nr:hypothetical protein CG017_01743 [Burkholderia glumae]
MPRLMSHGAAVTALFCVCTIINILTNLDADIVSIADSKAVGLAQFVTLGDFKVILLVERSKHVLDQRQNRKPEQPLQPQFTSEIQGNCPDLRTLHGERAERMHYLSPFGFCKNMFCFNCSSSSSDSSLKRRANATATPRRAAD